MAENVFSLERKGGVCVSIRLAWARSFVNRTALKKIRENASICDRLSDVQSVACVRTHNREKSARFESQVDRDLILTSLTDVMPSPW